MTAVVRGDDLKQSLPDEGLNVGSGTLCKLDRATIRVYPYRWVVLVLLCMTSMINGFQWIQYSIISNIIQKYYDISVFTVDWFSLIYMISYVPLIFPAAGILEKKGLRVTVILGAVGTCLGAWVKVFSVSPDLLVVAFIGQTIAASSQVFILSVPSRLAAVWFGPSQVSLACSLGAFGNQLGVALGFLLPPVIVKNHDHLDEIGHDLSIMFFSVAGLCTILAVLIVIFFRAEPPLPPSAAQEAQRAGDSEDFVTSLKHLAVNRDYMILLLAYGLMVGVFNAVSTLLNPLVLMYYPGSEEDAGRIGLTIILSGMTGSVLFGVVLDKTRLFKETILGLYVFTLVGMIVFTFTLNCGYIAVVYVISGFLGFFMTGFMPVGFEVGSELTYPRPEGTSAGILIASSQLGAVFITMLASWLLDNAGDKWANLVLCASLVIGSVITLFIRKDYRRQAAFNTDLAQQKE